MDRLDKISILAIALLLVSVFAAMHNPRPEDVPRGTSLSNGPVAENHGANSELDGKITMVKSLVEGNNLARAEVLLHELQRSFPYHGEPHMFMGDLLMRKQEPVKAMQEYRQAIDLNPDYLDKKTPLFQGRKLKTAAGEALAEVEKGLRLKPGDRSLIAERRVIYYLYRRIAGSCG